MLIPSPRRMRSLRIMLPVLRMEINRARMAPRTVVKIPSPRTTKSLKKVTTLVPMPLLNEQNED